ncbi:isochorismatase family protein [Paraburkholderia sp. BCC1885]|uniref:isochorismatase family protein n=1 Tax=Paraburkholderia sp. BCC1885 TaxID=2562669 RepID=UPI00118455D2|nr:isochorismatase family protein [Paraburkholderia sp. BCC1885]
MPLTAIDETPVLIIVDLQKGIGGSRLQFFDSVVSNSRRLADAFRARGLPVVLVNVVGGSPGRTEARQARSDDAGQPRARPEGWTELRDELDPQDSDIRVTKKTWGAFHGTGLAEILATRGVTQAVITGVATSIGVESTARSAYEHGLHVVLATDAMTDPNPEAHRNSLDHIFPRLGERATTDEILDKLSASGILAGAA